MRRLTLKSHTWCPNDSTFALTSIVAQKPSYTGLKCAGHPLALRSLLWCLTQFPHASPLPCKPTQSCLSSDMHSAESPPEGDKCGHRPAPATVHGRPEPSTTEQLSIVNREVPSPSSKYQFRIADCMLTPSMTGLLTHPKLPPCSRQEPEKKPSLGDLRITASCARIHSPHSLR